MWVCEQNLVVQPSPHQICFDSCDPCALGKPCWCFAFVPFNEPRDLIWVNVDQTIWKLTEYNWGRGVNRFTMLIVRLSQHAPCQKHHHPKSPASAADPALPLRNPTCLWTSLSSGYPLCQNHWSRASHVISSPPFFLRLTLYSDLWRDTTKIFLHWVTSRQQEIQLQNKTD